MFTLVITTCRLSFREILQPICSRDDNNFPAERLKAGDMGSPSGINESEEAISPMNLAGTTQRSELTRISSIIGPYHSILPSPFFAYKSAIRYSSL